MSVACASAGDFSSRTLTPLMPTSALLSVPLLSVSYQTRLPRLNGKGVTDADAVSGRFGVPCVTPGGSDSDAVFVTVPIASAPTVALIVNVAVAPLRSVTVVEMFPLPEAAPQASATLPVPPAAAHVQLL